MVRGIAGYFHIKGNGSEEELAGLGSVGENSEPSNIFTIETKIQIEKKEKEKDSIYSNWKESEPHLAQYCLK